MSNLISRLVLAVAATLVAIVCAAAAAGFLTGALYLYLRQLELAPALAALIVALALLALAASVIIALRIVQWRRLARISPRRRKTAGNGHEPAFDALAAQIGARAAEGVASAAETHPYYACSAAFLAGIVVGKNPRAIDIVEAALRATDGDARPHS